MTGEAGFIGGNFVHFGKARHPEDRVIVLDTLTYACNRSKLEDATNAELVVGDIRDTALALRVLRDRKIASIVHFAAESHVDCSIDGPDAFIDTKIIGTHSLLKAASSMWLCLRRTTRECGPRHCDSFRGSDFHAPLAVAENYPNLRNMQHHDRSWNLTSSRTIK